MSKKKVYRSLFDSDDVYEVEEISDNPEISTEGIATVKQDEGEITNKQIWDLLCEVRDTLRAKSVTDNEPVIENEVESLNQEIDGELPVTTNDEDEVKKVENEEETPQEVTDSYSRFARKDSAGKEDGVVATQVAFQNRYAKVANK